MSEDALLEEEDIWEYKSIRKKKHQSNSQSTSTPVQKVSDVNDRLKRKRKRKKKSAEKPDTPQKTKQRSRRDEDVGQCKDESSVPSQESVSSLAEQSSQNAKPVCDGHCPSCQMPFSLLLVQTPQWHVDECLDTPGSIEKECPDGLLCNSTIPSHYKRYSHFLLAANRAGDYLVDSSGNTLEMQLTCSTAAKPSCFQSQLEEISQDEKPSNDTNHVPNDDCALMVQSSPQMKSLNTSLFADVQKPQQTFQPTQTTDNSCRFEFYGFASSQESEAGEDLCSQKDESQPGLLQSKVDFSDWEISYSPLSTFEESEDETEEEKAKVSQNKLFKVQNLEDEDSDSQVFETLDELLSQKKPQYEHNETGNFAIKKNVCEEVNASNHLDHQQGVVATGSSLPSNCCEKAEQPALISSAAKAGNTESGGTGACALGSVHSTVTETSALLGREDAGSLLTQKSNGLGEPSNVLTNTDKLSANAIEETARQESLQTAAGRKGNLNTAAVCFPSPTSKSMPSLSLANVNAKSSPAKELKQMDIGVFFGLKPKAKEESKGETCLSERKQIPSSVTPNRKRPRQQKRKAEGSVDDVEEITESSSKNEAIADVSSRGQRRWRKKIKELPTTGEGPRKKYCPFYKKIPGTGFTVDAFQYGEIEGCTAYFLTHFHSDHYCGLTKNFRFPIYCNKITGNLVKSKLRVQEQYIHVLPMDTECIVDGIKVLLLDANHCPGATMILFRLPSGVVILHTGDFRADPSMERYPALVGQQVHTLYLDTTYCSPEYTFPSQQEVIQFAVNTAFETVTLNPRTLVVCGTYSIGKEKVFLVCAVFFSQSLQDHLNKFSESFDQVLAFKPTGWTYSDSCLSLVDVKPQTRGKITIYGIPYSEHSSYLEMKRFVQWLKPQKIIPTVNIGDWRSRSLLEKHFRDWMIEGSGHK
ncbi:DCR1A protein, partial [Sclerurus mexicanus]|nr:DCR1A protein [Sclerurus mexicanus]